MGAHNGSPLLDLQVGSALRNLYSGLFCTLYSAMCWPSVLTDSPYRPAAVQCPRQRTVASVRPPGLDRSTTAMGDAEGFAIAEHTP